MFIMTMQSADDKFTNSEHNTTSYEHSNAE